MGLKSLMAECEEEKEMQVMANEELGQAIEEERRLQNLLLKSLLPKDDADERDCILEVRAGNKYFLCQLFLYLSLIFQQLERKGT